MNIIIRVQTEKGLSVYRSLKHASSAGVYPAVLIFGFLIYGAVMPGVHER
jgi:hypothetical protein